MGTATLPGTNTSSKSEVDCSKLQQSCSFLFVHSAVVVLSFLSSVYLCCILRLYCPIRCSDLWDVSKTTATIQSDATRVTSCHILTCQSSNESNGSSVWTQQLRNAKTHISYGHATVDSMTVWHRDCIQRLHKELWKCKGKVRQTFQVVSADVLVSRKSLAAINHPIWMHSRTTCYTQKSESELLGNSMLNSAFRRH